ncbi:flagellar hook-associated protein FlgK [Blastococcus sp. PRF04-17]|uniref:flagellar hook-associated protein FlgK n=1 Tax=Blastococcus sp. PRF04-17 TaxID=2933797 RepID=UPI001FF6D995|nr:flagellar hook-associated protein FlgK [Blastococcus sp. PRF04-17]UOY03907.1 flagellar hook-associated protein FlgK [Blastococcus sp. PRF04-17]
MSTFSALNAATTALWAQRRALDVTGQNIANVNTEGYSRQRVDLKAIGGSAVPAFFSTSPGIGAGVNADAVSRIRDAFLEGRGHVEHANSARLVAETEAYDLVEQSFREPGDTGIQSLLSDMWKGWQDVANNPKEPAARGQVLQQLETLVGGIHFSQASLGAQWGQTRENLEVLVKDVNAAATTIAQLNKAIRGATQSGLPANDLADQRDLLVMKLADQIGATTRPGEDGMVDVIVGGMSLVSGTAASQFAVQGPNDPNLITPTDKPRIVTASGGFTVAAGGTAGGQLSALNVILPGYRGQLDRLAQDLAAALNTAHTTNAYDSLGNPGTPLLGSSGGPITAESLRVLITDPALVAASGVPPTAGVPAVDNTVADRIAQLRLEPLGVDASYRKMIVELGVQAAVSKRNLGIQNVITTQVDAARESVSGVNLDEEMTNMLSFQHAYAAAGRMVTAIDQTLDVLINRTGIVGR